MADLMIKKKPSGFKLRSIKCPKCGASISLAGGHNVTHVICSYCSYALELQKNNAAAYIVKKVFLPIKPLRIGQKGKLKGVDYAVIGLVGYRQQDEDGVYEWLEYLLFSPTHGYVWLCYEESHWVLVHEVKEIPDIDISRSTPVRTSFSYRDKNFKLFECDYASIFYLEGELTWDARIGDKILYSDSVCPPYMFCTEKRNGEIEYFFGEYIFPKEIKEAFGYETPMSLKVGPCEPVGSVKGKSLALSALITAVFVLILSYSFSFSGKRVESFSTKIGLKEDVYISEPILLDDPSAVYSIDMWSPGLSNAWAFADVQLIDDKEEYKIANCQFNTSYYFGYEEGERWSEGEVNDIKYFKIPAAGNYKFVVEGGGNTGESNTESEDFTSQITLTIYKGVRSAYRSFTFGILLAVFSIFYWVWFLARDSSRWPVDDDDDDD